MLKKLLVAIAIVGFFTACSENQPVDENNKQNTEEKISQKDMQNDIPLLSLADFDKEAGKYVGKEIKVNGIVDHICKHGGKKMLLVSDDGDVHIEAETRFDDSLAGSELIVTGIVKEFRVDEAYCLKMEEDNQKSHNEGKTEDEIFEQKQKQLAFYRDSMAKAGTDHLSFYSLDFVSYTKPEDK